MAPTSNKPTSVMVMRHAGTHLILPMVKLLTGAAIYRPKGRDSLICEPSGKVVVFVRNPRNWLISAFRWKRGRLPSDLELAHYMSVHKRRTNESPMEFATAWANRWLREPSAHLVRFEDLVDPDRAIPAIEQLADFLGTAADPWSVSDAVVGKGTFTGAHSNWRNCFGINSIGAYRKAGGEKLDQLMGYLDA